MASKKKTTVAKKSAAKKTTRSVQTAGRKKAAKKKTATIKNPVAKKKTATTSETVKKKATNAREKDTEKNKKEVTVKKTTTAKKATTPSEPKTHTAKKVKTTDKKAEAINHITKAKASKAKTGHRQNEAGSKAPVSETSKKVKKSAVRKATSDKPSTGKPKFVYKPEPSILDIPRENNGPRKRYSDNELQEFKDLIQRKLGAARKELVYLQGLITRRDEAGTDDTENKYMGVEDGGGTMEREQLSQLASRQIQYIDHLEKALVRIENKTYGICRETGRLIDKARLRAVPHATLSIEAKLAKKR